MSIRKFRKQMKPFIIILTVVFILSLAYGGYESYRTSRANKKAQEAMLLNKDYIQKIDIERAKQDLSRTYSDRVDKDIVDILAFNDVIDKNLTLHIAKDLKVKVPSSEVNKQYEELESSMGDKEQFRRMLQVRGLTKDSLKNQIEENLLMQKTREEFAKNINPTDEEINAYMALYSIPADKKEEAVNLYKSEKGAEAFREALLKARKEMQIKDLAPEYENLLEKTAYEEEGFTITNLDLARATANVMLGQKISKEDAEKQAKEMISRQIKMAKIAKEKGVKVNENLDSISQFQDYYIGLAEKVRDEVKPTDDELLKFFNANKSKYSIPATADAKLVFISVKSAKEDDDLAKEKAEKLLSELALLKGAIDSKNMLIEDLKKEGISIQKRETGVNVQSSKVYLSELEKVENRIEKLQEEITRIENVVNMVERALGTIRNNKYYDIIEMKYFDDLTFEHISEKLDISVITAKRYKNKMIRQLQLVIFSDDVIKNILN